MYNDSTSYSREYTIDGNSQSPSVKQLTLKMFVFIPIIFLIAGAAFLAIGIGIKKYNENKKASYTEEVSATVTELKEEPNSDESTTYRAVFYYTYNGQGYMIDDTVSSYPAEYDVGEEVTILVNPDSPNEIYTDTMDGFVKIFIYVFSGMGALFLLIAIISLTAYAVNMRKNKKLDEDELSQYYQ